MQSFTTCFLRPGHQNHLCVFINLVVFFSFNIPLVKEFRFFYTTCFYVQNNTTTCVFCISRDSHWLVLGIQCAKIQSNLLPFFNHSFISYPNQLCSHMSKAFKHYLPIQQYFYDLRTPIVLYYYNLLL